jgi:hypothetical protein
MQLTVIYFYLSFSLHFSTGTKEHDSINALLSTWFVKVLFASSQNSFVQIMPCVLLEFLDGALLYMYACIIIVHCIFFCFKVTVLINIRLQCIRIFV